VHVPSSGPVFIEYIINVFQLNSLLSANVILMQSGQYLFQQQQDFFWRNTNEGESLGHPEHRSNFLI
jgi:hypothetical protein